MTAFLQFLSSCLERGLAPCIVFVFYHEASGAVNDSYNVALKVVDVAVQRAVEVYHCRPALRIVEEVQRIATPGRMRYLSRE